MPKVPRCLLVVSLVIAGLSSAARAQSYACLSNTAMDTQSLYDAVVRIVTGTDSEAALDRNALQLPAVAASKVSVVTTASVCNKAGAAYHTAVTSPGTPAVSRTLVVIKVSSSRYVVKDPNQRVGEFRSKIVFDSKWKFLAGFVG
jgi:hypothetical protein